MCANFAIRSIKWPGIANLYVSLLAVSKNKIERVRKILDHKKVEYISPYFTDEKENLT